MTENAVYKLQQLNQSEIPFFTQYTEFYSKLIENQEIVGMLALIPGKVRRLEKSGLTAAEENIFDNTKQAVDFYKFQMQECLMRFIDDYFAEMEIEYIGREE